MVWGAPPLTVTVRVFPALMPCVSRLVGWNVLFATPKPTAAAAVAVPPTVIVSVSGLRLALEGVRTRLPLLLSEAETSALPGAPELMAVIRLPIVSAPFDVYVVVLTPSLTVIVLPKAIGGVSEDSKVAFVSPPTVPVPSAGASGFRVAPVPMICAPATGSDVNAPPFSDPTDGVLGRFA